MHCNKQKAADLLASVGRPDAIIESRFCSLQLPELIESFLMV